VGMIEAGANPDTLAVSTRTSTEGDIREREERADDRLSLRN